MAVPTVSKFRVAGVLSFLLFAPALLAASPREELPANPEPQHLPYDTRPFDPDPLSTAGPGGGPRVPPPGVPSARYGVASTDWAALIDQTWGPSPWSTAQMLAAFDAFWTRIDVGFACFQGIDVDWTSLRESGRAEIQAGVSRGRFAAIMNHLALALRESHTAVNYSGVNGSALRPGVPLFVVGGWGDSRHFRAGLTPLPDSSLLVYKAAPSHPLGLVPGDIVLGYDGVPWKRLYRELLAAQLPLTGWWWGSSSSSWTHSMLMSAGLNWHLFNTIDVVKHDTGETVHLPVSALEAPPGGALDCTEQLPIPGVQMPNYLQGRDPVSWGIVDGTRIGYVYVRAWEGTAGTQFHTAVQTLLNSFETTGLIFDFRTNYGGNMFLAYPALSLLFGGDVSTIGFVERCGPDHLALCPSPNGPPSSYVIHGAASGDYDRPIAVLVGPGALSSGDQVAHLFRFHPRSRFFGKSTATAFNAPTATSLGIGSGWFARFAWADAYRVSAPGDYLTHDELHVDEPVWLEPDDVARGIDTVAEAAIGWINNQAPVCDVAHATIDAWPPNHEFVTVVIEGVSDPDGDPVTVFATAIAQDEPVDGTGDGHTCPDAEIVDGVAQVRRERAGNGDGRVYLVSFTARDNRGGECQGTVQLCVPHDQGHGRDGCVDGGQRYESMTVCAGTEPALSKSAAPAYVRAFQRGPGDMELEYQLPADGWVDLGVYDVVGRRVVTLLRERQEAGAHRLEWSTRGLRPGVYFALLRVDQQTLARAMVVAR